MRKEILPMLENSGIIAQDPDPSDNRRLLITPQLLPSDSSGDFIDTSPPPDSTISHEDSRKVEDMTEDEIKDLFGEEKKV